VLEIENVRKTFNPGSTEEVKALDGVTLTLEKGSFTVVIGTNGSGKTTLLNAVAGSFTPDAGRIRLDGTDITRWPEHRRATMVGRVFQDPYAGTAPRLTVWENLALAARRGLRRRPIPLLRGGDRAGFRAALARIGLGLEERLDAPIGMLSGGQRQAITLVMACLRAPQLLLLDEHTAALDPRSARQVILLTTELVGERNLTTMMVTHSMQQAFDCGDRLVAMHRGKPYLDVHGAAKQSWGPARLQELFSRMRRDDRMDASTERLLAERYA
jgi:putative ABC transport system ATP-binding protein